MRTTFIVRRRLHECVVGLLEPGAAQRLAVALDRLPVAAGDRPRQLEPVLDRALHQRHERLGGSAGRLEEPGGDAVQRDEEVRRDRRAGVVERARSSASGNGRRPSVSASQSARVARFVVLAGHRAPGAVELLRAAREDEGLQRMHREAANVRVERGERRPARDVGDPRARLDRSGDLADRAVGHAQQAQLPVGAHVDASLAQSRGDRRAGASCADDGDGVEHVALQFLADTGHRQPSRPGTAGLSGRGVKMAPC